MGENRAMYTAMILRVGVVGAGAFGRNHVRVYRDLQTDPRSELNWSASWMPTSRVPGGRQGIRHRAFRSHR